MVNIRVASQQGCGYRNFSQLKLLVARVSETAMRLFRTEGMQP
jgi:hypothetical protein